MKRRRWFHGVFDYLKVFGPATLLAVAGFVVAFQFVDPAPPTHIVLATGEPDGAYHRFGIRYAKSLASSRVELELRPTAGSLENLALLEDDEAGVDAAFVQGGVVDGMDSETLRCLGSLYYEPLWVFHRIELPITRLPDLRGRRVAVGGEGSGTKAVAMRLLEKNGVTDETATLLTQDHEAAMQALMDDDVDAAFFIAAPQAQIVQDLLAARDLKLMSFDRAEALLQSYRFLSKVILSEGVVNLAENLPQEDITLLAPAATLVVRKDFHPALIDLLLIAASECHSPGSLLEAPGTFPAARLLSFPLSKEAKRHYESGPPLLMNYMPFWAATLVDRLKVMLLPLVALLFPLAKIMPPAYHWRMRRRIYRWYRELEAVELAAHDVASESEASQHLAQLDRLDTELAQVTVPLSFRDQLYNLRLHIDLVRRRVRAQIEN